MNKIFKKIKLFFKINMLRISMALYNVEQDVLKNLYGVDSEKSKYNIRKRHRNQVLEKMLQGQRDEKYVQDYYEILKKADKFLRESTPEQIEMAVEKYGMNLGIDDSERKNVGTVAVKDQKKKLKKDKWGRRLEHWGFFDPKHKHRGKKLIDVLRDEIGERTLDDDQYPIEFMFTNKPKPFTFVNSKDIYEKDGKFFSLSEYEKSKLTEFPLRVIRDNEVNNKIEMICEYLHIKKYTSKHRILEFFIPEKFKSYDYDENTKVFKDLITMKQVFISDEYGEIYGYKITNFYKRTSLKKNIENKEHILYDVIKMKATKIKKI